MGLRYHYRLAIKQAEERIRYLSSHPYLGVGRDLMDMTLVVLRYKRELKKLGGA